MTSNRSITTPLLAPLVLMACWVLSPAFPAAAAGPEAGPPSLFPGYRAGDPRADLAARPGMADCSAELGRQALCLDGVEHLGRDWAADFAFADGRLVAVSLTRPFDRSLYLDVFAAVTRNAALAALESAEGRLDLIQLLASGADAQTVSDRVTGFEARGIQGSRLAYIFLDKRSVAPLADKAGDLATMTAWAGPGLVRTVVVLFGDRTGDWLALIFEAPNGEQDR